MRVKLMTLSILALLFLGPAGSGGVSGSVVVEEDDLRIEVSPAGSIESIHFLQDGGWEKIPYRKGEFAGPVWYVEDENGIEIKAGKDNNIKTITVCTGKISKKKLLDYNPMLIIDDLTDTDRVLELINK